MINLHLKVYLKLFFKTQFEKLIFAVQFSTEYVNVCVWNWLNLQYCYFNVKVLLSPFHAHTHTHTHTFEGKKLLRRKWFISVCHCLKFIAHLFWLRKVELYFVQLLDDMTLLLFLLLLLLLLLLLSSFKILRRWEIEQQQHC